MKSQPALLTLLFIVICVLSLSAQYHVVPQTGHNDVIMTLEYSKDGKYLATAGHDMVILLWDTRTGLHWPLYEHAVGVQHLAFSPDNKFMISADVVGNVITWNVETREIVNRIKNNTEEEAFSKIQFINNEEVAMLNGKLFKLWNFKTNIITKKVPLKGTHFALNSKESTLLLLEEKHDLSTSGGFSSSNKMVLFDLKKQSPVDDAWIRTFGTKWAIGEFSESGKYLVLADARKIILLDYKLKKKIWEAPASVLPRKIIITPDDGSVIFSGNFETPDLFVYDLPTGKKMQHRSKFTDFSFAYNHTEKIVAGAHDASEYGKNAMYPISIYDLKSQGIIRTLYPNHYLVTQLAWSDKSNHLYVQGKNGNFVWDLSMGTIVQSNIQDFNREITDWKKGTIKLTNQSQGSTYYSPGKKYLAKIKSPEGGGLDVVDVKTKQTIFSIDNGLMFGISFSNDNTKLYRTTGDDLFVYDLTTGKQINHLRYDNASIGAIAYSLDGKYLAVGKFRNEFTNIPEKYYVADFSIDLLDPVTLKLIRTIKGHNRNVTCLDFTADNRFLISGSMDGTVRLWDPHTGNQKFILYGDSPNDYFIQAENGYYSSSKAAISKIAFSYNGMIVPGKIFEIQMNRPDKVAAAAAYSTPQILSALNKAFDKRMANLGIAEQQLKIENLPVVNLTGTLPPQTVATKNITINYEAFDQATSLDHIKLLVNNVPVHGRKGLSIKNKNQIKGKLDIELTAGINSIELSVVNSKGTFSLPVTFDVFSSVKTKPDLYLVTIGIDKFLDQEYNLNYAAKDAQDIAAVFEARKSTFGKFIHIPFSGMQATRDNILAVKDQLKNSKPDDQVIIFAATHGLLDEKYDYYLATYNMVFDRPAFQGLAYKDLENLMDGIPARKKLIILDACHSGEIDAAEITASTEAVKTSHGVKARGFKPVKKLSSIGIENTFDLMKNMFADLREGTGTTVISSAAGVEFAIESGEWSNGAFTAALLEGIKNKSADENYDGTITVGELKEYTFKRVIELTKGQQHPTSRIDNIDNNFSVISTVATTTAKVIDLTGSWEPYEVDSYKDGKYKVITNKQGFDKFTITRGVDGFYYIFGNLKLLPASTNVYNGPGMVVLGETETTLIKQDSYGNVRYKKIQ